MVTMKAIQVLYKQNGATDTISIPKPTIENPEDILVKVQYSALDTAFDTVMNKTFTGSFIHKFTDPLLLAWHFSGTVEAVGDAASKDFAVGASIFGHLQYAPETEQGSLAEYIVVKADAVAMIPKGVKPDVACAASTEVLTALQSLRNQGGLTDGGKKKQQSVLINGAGGQVGASAVQIAKRMGATVTAICSTKDVERVARLGAGVVIDRKKTPKLFAPLTEGGYDVIFDTPNALSPAKSLRYLKPSGNYVMTLPNLSILWGMLCTIFSKKSVTMVSVHSKKEDLELVGTWLQDGFEVDIDCVVPISNVGRAIARNRETSKKGRVVVQVEEGW